MFEQTRKDGPSLRLVLSLTMVLLVASVAAALITFGYFRARAAAFESVDQRMTAFADRLSTRLTVLSGDTSTLIGTLGSVASAFLASPDERLDDKINALRETLLTSQHIDGVYVGYPDGSFFHAVNLSGEGWRQRLRAPAQAALAVRTIDRSHGDGRIRVIFLDVAARRIGAETRTETGYDPRLRPWYREAIGRHDPVATGPYEMATTGVPGMTISRAHRGKSDVVIGADVVLTTITAFLREELLTPGSIAFIADGNGRPIVHSDPATMDRILEALEDREALAPGDNLTGELALRASEADVVSVTAGGRSYLVRSVPIANALLFRNDRIVIAAPYEELMAPANRALRQGLLIASTVVGIGIAGALVLAGLITASLKKLTEGANRMQDLDFRTPIEAQSDIREISALSRAMNRARDAIFTFALYVPRELVRKGMESGAFSGRTATRQEVTAAFTDIYDFTAISEHYPPEDVVTMLSVYFDVLNQAVRDNQGTIIQFLGDSVFAMWNAPANDEHHVENACRAALAMRQALDEFNALQRFKGLPEFRTRIGIQTGTAVVGSVGAADRLQYTAMGDTINVASRLEGMNKTYGTTILTTAEVRARAGTAIKFRPLGRGKAKGREVSIELFEVVDVADGDHAHEGGDGQNAVPSSA